MPQLSREQVHEALRWLYESVELCHTELAAAFPETAAAGLEEQALRLQRLLLHAIEALCPARRYPFGSLESRSYDVLTLRYVENMPIRQIAEELALSERQVHRDLWRAEERLTAVLNSRLPPDKDEQGDASPFEDELEYLRSQPTQVCLVDVLRSAIRLVEPLTQQLPGEVRFAPADEEASLVAADQAVLKQVLAQLLSAAVQAASGDVTAQLAHGEESVSVELRFGLGDRRLLETQFPAVQRIAASQGYQTSLCVDATGQATMTLSLSASPPVRVLIVEDNPGSVELYRRYLATSSWQVHAVSDPRHAFAVAQELQPDVIVLDIMMPKMDGWSVLEQLSRRETTRSIPVLVCSVVQDERLGQALGARVQLHKPVSRGQFLAAINQCLPRTRPGPQ
ncbi:MAG: response regulator [Anaerolineae bacterium]|nr:response regulator [Anaerolineae bacterium]